MSPQESNHKLQESSNAKLTGYAKSHSAIDESAAMINSQDGRMSVLALGDSVAYTVVVATVGAAGCVLGTDGVVTGGRGAALLRILRRLFIS